MDSPELETRSSLDLAGVPRRGPHPNRDYKRHFNRQKERFDAATTVRCADQAGRLVVMTSPDALPWGSRLGFA